MICKIFVLNFLILGTQIFAQGGMQYVKVKQENIRLLPGGKKIGVLDGGTQVEVVERRANWVKVQVPCWIWESSLTTDPSQVEGFKIRAGHILVATEAEAQKVLTRLKKGESFEEIAKQSSIHQSTAPVGGDLGYFERGDFFPEIEDVAFKLKIGEYSAVVQSKVGFHIIHRTE